MNRLHQIIATVFLSFFPYFLFSQNGNFKISKTKSIEIKGKKFQKIFGYIEVPENWQKSDSRVLRLPIEITKSASLKPQEPIFYLNGGPGASNILRTRDSVFLKNHDYIFVGYRGADGNTKLTSKSMAKSMKGLNSRLLSDESLDNVVDKMKKYRAEIAKESIDINQYNMMAVIEDLEYARKAIGYEKINLLGVSYGTRVALLYGYKYPKSIHKTVMIGANPPGKFEFDAQKTEEIIGIWDSLYLANGKKSVKESMKKAFDNMPKRWSFYRLDADKIKCIAFFGLYQKSQAVMAFDAFQKAADKGDYSGLYLMQLLFDKIIPKTYFGDMFSKGFSADLQPNVNYRKKYRDNYDSTLLGPNYSLLLWGLSDGWSNYRIPEEYRQLRPSATETLIISGDLDPSTPADFAKNILLPTLKNGKQIIRKNMSHSDIIDLKSIDDRKFIIEYLEKGTLNENYLQNETINFTPKRSFNKLAKWGYPVVFFASIFN